MSAGRPSVLRLLAKWKESDAKSNRILSKIHRKTETLFAIRENAYVTATGLGGYSFRPQNFFLSHASAQRTLAKQVYPVEVDGQLYTRGSIISLQKTSPSHNIFRTAVYNELQALNTENTTD